MKLIPVDLNKRSYDIIIGRNALGSAGQKIKQLSLGADAYIITNPLVKNKYGKILSSSLKHAGLNFKFVLIPDSEKSKSFHTASILLNRLADFDKNRRVFVIAFGGGVVGDIAGWVASVYRRGINYIQVPTTLLAQVDSSIGGKTAIDLSLGKNLVGAFYQPRLVLSDTNVLKSLRLRQLQSGIAEVIKYALIKDRGLFVYLQKNYPRILKSDPEALESIIYRSSAIKARIVEMDERETKGQRILLNFGHTIGHAIETAGKYAAYTHGEAIALGMIVACNLSRASGLISQTDCLKIEKLISNIGLPVKIKGLSQAKIIEAHYHDKKFLGRKNRFVMLQAIGKAKIRENVPLNRIRQALAQSIV